MKYVPAYTAIVLAVVSGVVHGFWTDRWTVSDAAAQAAARLAKLPLSVGDWEAQTLRAGSKSSEAITGELHRRYVNKKNGSAVTVVIFSGLPGPVAIHTPDVCYGAAGFKVESPVRYQLPADGKTPAAELWTADLHKTRVTDQIHQRFFWSWTSEGAWEAPAEPRVSYVRKPALFKIYLVRQMTAPSEPLDGDPCIELLRQMLPQLQKELFDK